MALIYVLHAYFVLDRMKSLGFTLQKEAELEALTLEVLKSSEIEGRKT
jgi:hypothetical protein